MLLQVEQVTEAETDCALECAGSSPGGEEDPPRELRGTTSKAGGNQVGPQERRRKYFQGVGVIAFSVVGKSCQMGSEN